MRSSRLHIAVSVALAALSLPLTVRADDPAADGNQPAHQLDRIQVRGARSPADAERALTPGAVTIIDADSLRARSVGNLSDALRYVPGVWTQSATGGDAVFISSAAPTSMPPTTTATA
ncbi:TonB-dependent receptor plug domain-containing protein [Lysobacter xanthus]